MAGPEKFTPTGRYSQQPPNPSDLLLYWPAKGWKVARLSDWKLADPNRRPAMPKVALDFDYANLERRLMERLAAEPHHEPEGKPHTKERLKQLSESHRLDSSGYEYENPSQPELIAIRACIWDNPTTDLMQRERDLNVDFHSLSCPIYAFVPGTSGVNWPFQVTSDNGYVWNLKDSGAIGDTEHSCTCHGKQQCPRCECEHDFEYCPDCGTSKFRNGKIGDNAWRFTGNVMDPPHPDCSHCDGDGYVICEAGDWALYALHEENE
jgi:hypothetical protein